MISVRFIPILTAIFVFVILQNDDEHLTNKRKYMADDRNDSGKDLKKVRLLASIILIAI